MKKEDIKNKAKLASQNTVHFLDEKVAPKMASLASQKHLLAIRNGIVSTIPFIIVGSMFLIIINFPLGGAADSSNLGMLMPPQLKEFFLAIYYLSMGAMGLYAAFGIASELGKAYKFNVLLSGLLGVFAYLLWFDYSAGVGSSFSGGTVFTAMIAAIVAVEIQHLCIRFKLTIRMPEVVPKAISDSFLVITPIFFTAILFGSFRYLLNFDLNNFLAVAMQPMQDILTGGLIGVVLIVLLVTFFWSFGIHGTSIVGSVVRPFWQVAIDENSAWAMADSVGEVPYLYPEQFLQWFIWIGGAGATLGLVISTMMVAKSKQAKAISKASIVPGLFNINEPVIFGYPIILNGTLMIPFILAPLTLVIVSAICMPIFSIAFTAVSPWTLPGPIGALFSAGMNPWAFMIVIMNIVISILIYTPFVVKWDRKLRVEESDGLTLKQIKELDLKDKELRKQNKTSIFKKFSKTNNSESSNSKEDIQKTENKSKQDSITDSQSSKRKETIQKTENKSKKTTTADTKSSKTKETSQKTKGDSKKPTVDSESLKTKGDSKKTTTTKSESSKNKGATK